MASIAGAVNRTRQTVRKVIADETQSFSALDVMRICEHLRTESSIAGEFAKKIATKIYPKYQRFLYDYPEEELGEKAVGIPESGEYWFVCRDFLAFKANYKRCMDEFCKIVQDERNVIVAFSSHVEWREVSRYIKSPHSDGRYSFTCDSETLNHYPAMMFHSTSGDASGDDTRMYLAHEKGFTEVAKKDAATIKEIFNGKRAEASTRSSELV